MSDTPRLVLALAFASIVPAAHYPATPPSLPGSGQNLYSYDPAATAEELLHPRSRPARARHAEPEPRPEPIEPAQAAVARGWGDPSQDPVSAEASTRSANPQDKPDREELPSVDSFVEDMSVYEGPFSAWWDARKGRLYLAPPAAETEFLHMVSLPGGLGSNEVGLDRGQIGTRRLVRFERQGPRVLLVAPNLDWRAEGAPQPVVDGVRASFAPGVLWGFELVAGDPDGRVLVDATDFFLRDAHQIAKKLKDRGQGSYKLEGSRSVLLPDALGAFPDNLEVEALLTFVSEAPGSEVSATAADPGAPALRVRHSFVRLPELDEERYRPRSAHPHCGFFTQTWSDLAAPIDEALARSVVQRHQLDAEHPIVYYVDRAAPEPVRSALLEGARYWEPVFEAAGFPGGFRAELLPEGADPQDVRYNVVQWVQRSTRGWSYGDSVCDPRTGEILKGHVSLGALRVRQDVLLAEGLLAPYAESDASDERVLAMALARIRQLSAHEIGHTLGLAHNFAASAHGRASVMDYPAPLVGLEGEDGLDLSDAYREGCGEWDELAVRYGYGRPELRGEQEAAYLAGVIDQMYVSGQRFLTDSDARGSDRAHPLANLWDNGADPVSAMELTLEVRRRALAGLSAAALKRTRTSSELERVLLPVYLHHRYQLEACARQLGGVDYDHRLVGEGGGGRRIVPAARQRAALAQCLEALEPARLALDPALVDAISAQAPGRGLGREAFETRALLFDPLAAAASACELALGFLLNGERLARMEDQALREPEQPSGASLMNALVELAWGARADEAPQHAALRRELRALVLGRLFRLALDESAAVRVRALALRTLQSLEARILGLEDRDPQRALELNWLRRFRERPETLLEEWRAPRIPPGSPIGCESPFEPLAR